MAAVANSYILPQANRPKSGVLTAAKASHANSTDAVKICDADADGSLIKKVTAIMRGTMAAANKISIYWSPDAGTTMYLIDQVVLAAYTQAATTAPTPAEFNLVSFAEPFYLPASHSLWAGMDTALAVGVVVTAWVEDY